MKLKRLEVKALFYAWNQFPLKVKLTLPIIFLQIVGISTAIFLLVTWLTSARLKELYQSVDSQSDALEDNIILKNGVLTFDLESEFIREVFSKKNFYFVLMSTDGRILDESQAAPEKVRDILRNKILEVKTPQKNITRIEIEGDKWKILSDTFFAKTLMRNKGNLFALDDRVFRGYKFSAVNTKPVMNEIAFVQGAIVLGALALVLLTSLGIFFIISKTTSNLNNFAQSLAAIVPENPEWHLPFEPRSAEEKLLFNTFQTMFTTIQKFHKKQVLFIANASHELKTPIAAMLMAIEVMLSKPRQQNEYVETGKDILNNLRGLKKLTLALLNFARLDNIQPIIYTNIILENFFDDLILRFKLVADMKNISIQKKTRMGLKTLRTNAELLEVAIGNFLENAIKYSPDFSVVYVDLKIEGDFLKIIVGDSGIGMNEEDINNLGEIFFKTNEARSDPLSFGLGFAQAKKIITLLGGKIEVKSAMQQGTAVETSFEYSI